ncbi:MAG: hypothetical protein LBN03_02180 [Bifidobacteriaceae bacterium]|jgi:tRNA A37 threonylcarbamoyladenosine modification protein TsaB|nr:hypothetical protein [Bifidobacteriaceae bacterium]
MNKSDFTLVIDTSEGTSIGLFEGETLIKSNHSDTKNSQVETLANSVKSVIEGITNLNKIIVSPGPARFTGLRAGISFAEALAMGVHSETYAVPYLKAASNVLSSANGIQTITTLFARKNLQYYYNPLNDEFEIASPEDIENLGKKFEAKIADAELTRSTELADEVLKEMYRLSLDLSPVTQIEPNYLRPPDVY